MPGDPPQQFPSFDPNEIDTGWQANFTRFRRILHSVLTQITIELPLLLLIVGQSMGLLPAPQILTDAVCRNDFANATTDCSQLHNLKSVQDAVLSKVSSWNIIIQAVDQGFSLPAMLLWSAWADQTRDRIVVMLIPAIGFIFSAYSYALVGGMKSFPIWPIVVAHTLEGVLGSMGLFINSTSAYLNDVVRDRRYLTIRLSIIFVIQFLGLTFGGLINGALEKHLSLTWILTIALILMAIAIVWFAFGIPQPKARPALMSFTVHESRPNAEPGDTDSFTTLPDSRQVSVDDVNYNPQPQRKRLRPNTSANNPFKATWRLLKGCWRAYTRPRPHHKRTYLLLVLLAVFFANLGEDGNRGSKNLFMQQVGFTPSQFSYFMSASTAIQLVCMLFFTIVLKQLNLPDTVLALVGLVSAIAQIFVFGASTTHAMVWISAGIGFAANLSRPAFAAMLLHLASPSERGRIIAGNGVSSGLANLIAGIIFSSLYSKTVDWCPGMSWYISGALICVALVIVIYLHFALRFLNDEILSDPESEDDDHYAGRPKMKKGGPK